MRKNIISVIVLFIALLGSVHAQESIKRVYNEEINPNEQIDKALVTAKAEGKFVVCQVGGN